MRESFRRSNFDNSSLRVGLEASPRYASRISLPLVLLHAARTHTHTHIVPRSVRQASFSYSIELVEKAGSRPLSVIFWFGANPSRLTPSVRVPSAVAKMLLRRNVYSLTSANSIASSTTRSAVLQRFARIVVRTTIGRVAGNSTNFHQTRSFVVRYRVIVSHLFYRRRPFSSSFDIESGRIPFRDTKGENEGTGNASALEKRARAS